MDQSEIQSLLELVEALKSDLEKKTNDLTLAAEIGQELLQENSLLKEHLNFECPRCKDMNIKISGLERSHSELLEQFDQLELKNHSLSEQLKASTESLTKVDSTKTEIEDQMSILIDRIKELQEEKQRLAKEKTKLTKDNQGLQATNEKHLQKINELTAFVREMEQGVLQSETQRGDLVNKLNDLETQNETLNTRIIELEDLVDTYQSYKEECDEKSLKIEQLNLDIEWMRESNEKLTARLSLLEPQGSKSSTEHGGKTLLSEIEDRRQELIKAHQALEQKHHGLAETHTRSLYRQQKMKHHIARLSQLNDSDYANEKIRDLEQALAQCESEKLELENTIDRLQSKNHLASEWIDEAQVDQDQDQNQLLKFRLQQLIEECEVLKQSNKTLRLVKNGESDKLQRTTLLLHEKERELEGLKRQLSTLKFEFDEFKLSVVQGVKPSEVNEILAENSKPPEPTKEEPAKLIEIVAKIEVEDKENIIQNTQVSVNPEFKPKPRLSNTGTKTSTVAIDRSNMQEDCKQQ